MWHIFVLNFQLIFFFLISLESYIANTVQVLGCLTSLFYCTPYRAISEIDVCAKVIISLKTSFLNGYFPQTPIFY